MKANEVQSLRLGNLIRVKKGVLGDDVPQYHWTRGSIQVTSIVAKTSKQEIFSEGSKTPLLSIPTVEFLINNCESDKFEFIPLTEEWLLKFGFVYNNKTEYFIKSEIHCFIGKTDRTLNRFILAVNLEHTVFILYVHQLQNLYFALTGEELTERESK